MTSADFYHKWHYFNGDIISFGIAPMVRTTKYNGIYEYGAHVSFAFDPDDFGFGRCNVYGEFYVNGESVKTFDYSLGSNNYCTCYFETFQVLEGNNTFRFHGWISYGDNIMEIETPSFTEYIGQSVNAYFTNSFGTYGETIELGKRYRLKGTFLCEGDVEEENRPYFKIVIIKKNGERFDTGYNPTPQKYTDQSGMTVYGTTEFSTYVTVPYDLISPDKTTETFNLRCGFYFLGSVFGEGDAEKQNTFKITRNSSIEPSISELSVTVSGNPSGFSNYIQSISEVNVSVTASDPTGGKLSYSIAAFNNNFASADGKFSLGKCGVPGTQTITAIVTNARGWQVSQSTTISVLPYMKPMVIPPSGYSDIQYGRSNSTGTLQDSGTYLMLNCGRQYTHITENGVEKNKCTISFRTRQKNGSWPSTWTTFMAESYSSDYKKATYSKGFSTNISYELAIRAVDTIGNVTEIVLPISTSTVNFSMLCKKTGVAFGKKAENENEVDIAQQMTLRIRGKLVIDGSGWKQLTFSTSGGSVWQSTVSAGRAPDSGFYYRIDEGNHVSVCWNLAFRHTAGSTLSLNATPIPLGYRPAKAVHALFVCENCFGIAEVDTAGYAYILWTSEDRTFTWSDGLIDYWI